VTGEVRLPAGGETVGMISHGILPPNEPHVSTPKGATMSISSTMTATVLVAPHRFELQDRPTPAPGDEDVLVRVRACGI